MTKDRTRLVNLNNIAKLQMEHIIQTAEKIEVRYVAIGIDGDTTWIGTYEATPENENILEKIAQCEGAINVFYMPEE